MYDNGGLGSAGAAAGGLAATGPLLDGVWLFLAAFAILSGILAVARILPRLR